MADKIRGGFYLKARKTQQSWIAHAPPHVREIWDWLLLNANWKDDSGLGKGRILTSYKEIREGLHWMVGYRKERYKNWQCEISMKLLTKAAMIATTKTTRGLIVTILNYNKYQDPKNYESRNEIYTKATRKPQGSRTILKEVEEVEEVNINPKTFCAFPTQNAPDGNGHFILTRRKKKLAGKRLEAFLQFWDAFGYKKGKAAAADSWLEIPQLTNTLVEQIIEAAKTEAKYRPDQIARGRTPIYAQGWITARRWEDEPYEAKDDYSWLDGGDDNDSTRIQ